MYESIKQGLNNSLSLANVQAQNAQRKGQQIGNMASQLGNIVDNGMSAYAQSKANNMQYDMKQELTLKQKDFLNVDNPNASKDYSDWVENTINERVEQEGGLAKGYLKEALSGIRDEVRADFDKQLIQKTDSMNKMTIEDTVDKAIKATSKGDDLNQYDRNYVYSTEYGENGLTVVRKKIDLPNPYDADSEELSDEEKRFNKLLNIVYHSYCGMTDQTSAKALVDSQLEQIEMKLIHEDALGLINDWGMNGRILDDGQKKYYTPEELKTEIKYMYREGNSKPYLRSGFSGREFDYEESEELAKFIDGKVDSFYNTVYATSQNTIAFGMDDYWSLTKNRKGGEMPDSMYSSLAQKGLIVYDAENEKVVDHSKIEPSLWNTIDGIATTNRHIKIADDWAMNPVDFSGDGAVTIDDFLLAHKNDREAVKYLDYDQKTGQWFVPAKFGYQDMKGNVTFADSTLQHEFPSEAGVEQEKARQALLGEINTEVRNLEDVFSKALRNLNLFYIDPDLNTLVCSAETGTGEYSNEVLNGLEYQFASAFESLGLQSPIITDIEKKQLKSKCEQNGLDYDSALRTMMIQKRAVYLAEVGYQGATSYTDVLKNVFRNEVYDAVKQNFKDSYNEKSTKFTSSDIWQKDKQYEKEKTFETLSKEASDLVNKEIYTHNGIEYVKTKNSAVGKLQSYYDKVLSGEWDYMFAQNVIKADQDVSVKDTDEFCGEKFENLIKKATDAPYVQGLITSTMNEFKDVAGEYQVFRVLSQVLYNVKDYDMNTIDQAMKKASAELSSVMATKLDDGLKEYSSSSSTKYTYSVNKGDSNFNSSFDKELNDSKERMGNLGEKLSVAPAMVDSYINSPSMDFDGQLAFFKNLNKLDESNKRNRLLVESLHAVGIYDEIQADSPDFAKQFNDILNNYKLNDGDIKLILDIAGDMWNRADMYNNAYANTIGVPTRQDSTKKTVPTDKGMNITTDGKYIVSLDGNEFISTDFLGEEKNGDFDYEPARKNLKKACQRALDDAYENDQQYREILNSVIHYVDLSYGEFNKIREDFEKDGDESKARNAIEMFMSENPYATYVDSYVNTKDLGSFFERVEKEMKPNLIDDINYKVYEAYANRIITSTDEYKQYYENKKKLESKEFSSTGSWKLPDMKFDLRRDGRIDDVVKIDRRGLYGDNY